MINYMQTNILDMIEYVGEDNCQKILSAFVCPLNPDVEDFIQTKAIQFAKQKIVTTVGSGTNVERKMPEQLSSG